jgi:hypothetical protein
VRVAAPEQVADCERLGRTSTKVLARVLFVPRSAARVERELARLARNEAAAMGGDTVVPETPVEDGRRSFGVYRCGA